MHSEKINCSISVRSLLKRTKAKSVFFPSNAQNRKIGSADITTNEIISAEKKQSKQAGCCASSTECSKLFSSRN